MNSQTVERRARCAVRPRRAPPTPTNFLATFNALHVCSRDSLLPIVAAQGSPVAAAARVEFDDTYRRRRGVPCRVTGVSSLALRADRPAGRFLLLPASMAPPRSTTAHRRDKRTTPTTSITMRKRTRRPCQHVRDGTARSIRIPPTQWGLLLLLLSVASRRRGPSSSSSSSSSFWVDAAMMFGVQSGGGLNSALGTSSSAVEGSRYATSMFFDADIERLHITGSVYYSDASTGGSQRTDCFLSSLQLPETFEDRGPTWVRQNSYGAPASNSTDSSSSSNNSSVICSSIFMGKYQGIRTYFLAGYSDVYPDFLVTTTSTSTSDNGVTPRLSQDGGLLSRTVDRYGFVAELNYAAQLYGGRALEDDSESSSQSTTQDRVQYPVAIVGNGTDGRGLIVATIHSNVPYENSMYKRYLDGQLESQPNPDVTGAFLPPRFEKGCSVSVTGWEQTKINENFVASSSSTSSSQSAGNGTATTNSVYDNLRPTWTKELRSREGDSVFLSSVLVHPWGGDVLVAGYTAGTSSDFGASKPDGTIDSFVTNLNPSTGATLRSMRLQSLANSTDLILGLCAQPLPSLSPASNSSSKVNASSAASASFYAVGMTNEPTDSDLLFPGSGSYKTFILKLGLESFELEWSAEINAVPASGSSRGDVMGLSCAVTRDGALLYVAGTVMGGASLTLNGSTVDTSSAGGDDMFVAQFRTSDGSVRFIRQIGTAEDDWLASGDALATDSQGNGIVLGNTRGSMFRSRTENSSSSSTSDVVVFSINRSTGAYTATAGTSLNSTDPPSNATKSTSSPAASTTEPTASPTPLTFRHSSEAPSLLPGWSLRGNRTISPFVPSNSSTSSSNRTNGTTNTTGEETEPSKAVPNASSSSSSSSKLTDTVLVASIAMLVAIIGASCVALLVVRYRRRTAKALNRTLTHAEDFPGMPHHQRSSQSSHRWAGGFGSRGGSVPRRGRNTEDHHQDPTETSSYASYVSGETLRSNSRRKLDPVDRDTLLRLDPSLGSDSYDEEESYSRFSHPIPDQDRYHPSVALNSVRRGDGKAAAASPNRRSRESIDEWDPRDTRESNRTLAMPTLSSNDDASYTDSDTIPTTRGGGVDDDDEVDTTDRAGTATSASNDADFRETIDPVPSSDYDDGDYDNTSMFDPSTIASASSASGRHPSKSNTADLLSSLGLRSRDSVDSGYSVDMLFAKLRRKRGMDPEPSGSQEHEGDEDDTSHQREGSDKDDSSRSRDRGVLS